MNERIKELARQACDIMPLYDSINRGDYTHSQYNMQIELLLEKFADLIVREYIDLVDIMERIANSTNASVPTDYDKHTYLETLDTVRGLIKTHFGAE